MKVHPSLPEFMQLAEEHNAIPVYTEMSADLETPISLYLKLVGNKRGFMLESAEGGKNFGRYSYIGLNPFAEITGYIQKTELVLENQAKKIILGKPLDVLKEFMEKFKLPQLGQQPFLSGGVGYFAYDIVTSIEKVRNYHVPADFVVMQMMFCRLIVVMDHLTHTLHLYYLAPIDNSVDTVLSYETAVKELQQAVNCIISGQPCGLDDNFEYQKGLDRENPGNSKLAEQYAAMVEKAKEYICVGDAFQIVLSHEFKVPISKHPFNLYRRLRQVNPSPYMFYLNFDTKKIIGASPEMLVKVDKGKVYTCPIAGTRPRGTSEEQDDIYARELLADEKERAEHSMLVDLGRNDLGRISTPGTVRVEQFMQIEKFSHVMHLVSLVSGQLGEKYTAIDALQACFPAGTVSGAPKVRAMEIIHELEGDLRGEYAGAVGYIDFSGNMNTCITIRTMIVKDGCAIIRVGAGIVYDSVPELEYQEVIHKGTALFKLLAED